MNTSISPNSNTAQSVTSERLSLVKNEVTTSLKDSKSLTTDTVSISEQASDLQRLPQEIPSSTNDNNSEPGNEVVRVSSTIGQSSTQGQLNTDQATKLYNEIAALL